jgi:NAD(P)-dependent dehydrogenase (short-subunit alcohol dehydrogenase family)
MAWVEGHGRRFSGKVALVTGGASGVGRAVAVALASEGALVVLTDPNEALGLFTLADIEALGGQGSYVAADATHPATSEAVVAATLARHGRLDVAVNSAALSERHVVRENLSGVYTGMCCQIGAMLTSGGGALVNLASITDAPGRSTVLAARDALLGITRAAALAYASRGIRCNVVGPILGPSEADRHQAEVSGEVTRLVLWLCSGEAAFVNGEYHAVESALAAKHRAPLVQS